MKDIKNALAPAVKEVKVVKVESPSPAVAISGAPVTVSGVPVVEVRDRRPASTPQAASTPHQMSTIFGIQSSALAHLHCSSCAGPPADMSVVLARAHAHAAAAAAKGTRG